MSLPSSPQEMPVDGAFAPGMSSELPTAKPFYKKWWFIALAVFLGLAVIGGLSQPNASQSTTASATSSSSASPSADPIELPALVGMRGDQAEASLQGLGVTRISFKDEAGKKAVIKVSNWTVTSQTPAAGTKLPADATITLFVHHDTETPAAAQQTSTPEAAASNASSDKDVPREHRKALKTAETYATQLHMSKRGIYDQLVSQAENFSPDAAQYAIDNVQADWNANALAKAKEYERLMNMSDEAIRNQLTSEYGEQFTAEEADYAVSHLGD